MSGIEEIKEYWDRQAEEFGDRANATTQDVYLREIEMNYICNFLSAHEKPLKVLDIGCGNGYNTFRYKELVPQHEYVGGDYSSKMIDIAQKKQLAENIQGISFVVMDVMCLASYGEKYDVIISDRCLINLGDASNRKKALVQIWKSLKANGKYLMIENFIEGHTELNNIRELIDLPHIDIRWHNSFFSKMELLENTKDYFNIERFENISSIYYLITRVAYSKACMIEGREPDYNNSIYKAAAMIPPIGNYGPICACILKRGV